jgi:phosphate transport system permease protein
MRTIDQCISRGRRIDGAFQVLGWASTLLCLLVLGALLYALISDGWGRLGLRFLTTFASTKADQAGALAAWVGSMLVMLVTAATAIPLGIAAGAYLEEYARKNWFTSTIEINIANLAAVPSIIYGLMALGLLVYQFRFGQSILAGGVTLAFLILPIVIVATRESLRAIPQTMREAAYALGASRWRVMRDHLLPYSLGGISTGVIIALSRAIGETAPLVTIGAITYIAFLPPAPLAPRPWLPADISKVALAGPAQHLPLGEALNRPIGPGELTFHLRDYETKRESPPIAVALPTGATGEQLRAAIDGAPGLSAEFTPSGYLSITADLGWEFTVRDGGVGIVEALQLDPGGGRYGPADWVWSPFTVLPIQMFNWVSRPDADFAANAAAAGVLLMAITLGMNAVAIAVRSRMRRRVSW